MPIGNIRKAIGAWCNYSFNEGYWQCLKEFWFYFGADATVRNYVANFIETERQILRFDGMILPCYPRMAYTT